MWQATTAHREQVSLLRVHSAQQGMQAQERGIQARTQDGARQAINQVAIQLMNWLNSEVAWRHRPEFTSSSPAEIGIWFLLSCYCAHQENGGVIRDCDTWTDRQWLIACGFSEGDVKVKSRLWTWKTTSLIVAMYPVAREKEVAAKRAAGKATQKLKWQRALVQKSPPESKLSSKLSSKLNGSSARSSPSTEGEVEVE